MATKKKATAQATPEATSTSTPAEAPKPSKPKKAKPTHPALTGKSIAFYGKFLVWPSYHHAFPQTVAKRYGATVVDTEEKTVAQVFDGGVDVIVFGDGAGAKADAKKAAEKAQKAGKSIAVLDEAAFRDLVKIDLAGKRFLFAGGFDLSPAEEKDGVFKKMAEDAGAVVDVDVTDDVDYVVVGPRKGDKKISRVNAAKKIIAADAAATLQIIDESAFLELVRKEKPLSPGQADFAGFMGQLTSVVDQGKLGRAMKMLKAESFKLFTKLDDDRLVGVVKSQTGSGDVYAPWIKKDGRYGCCNQGLDECMGLGGVCKHLLVVVVGLVRTENMKADVALSWLKLAQRKSSTFDKDGCALTFVEYKGAEAGTVDWRPTETLPEDFMAL
jgi:hypothetical protein